MKKIIIPFDGAHYSTGALEFARRLNEIEPILLAGIFLPQVEYANLWSYSGAGMAGPVYVPLVEDQDVEVLEKNIDRFIADCDRFKIEHRVHKNYLDFALPELRIETRFADLLILGGEVFYENMGTKEPNTYLKDTLRMSECPVLIIPEAFTFPESVVLSYNGGESSVYAIKQFAYLFPQLAQNPTLLVTTGKDEAGDEFPEESNIEELAARHYQDLTFMKIQIEPRKYFATWLSERQPTILVSGSFGRSAFSDFFKRSFITDVISSHQFPVFLTHR